MATRGDWQRLHVARSADPSPERTRAGEHPDDLREFVCGWVAASINIVMTFPMNKVMFRQQLHGISMHKAVVQLQKEGLTVLYRGLLPPMLQKTTTLAIMFGMYDKFQVILKKQAPQMTPFANKFLAANLSGCTEAILTPFERVQTLLQDKYYQNKFRNTTHAFTSLRRYGVSEYYRGLVPILIRNGPSNATFFLLRGELKSALPQSRTKATNILSDFICGGFLGALISTMFYPVNVVKTYQQSRVGGDFISFRSAFWTVFTERNRSWRKMFRGVHINYTRSMLSWGIINASYELVKELIYSDQPETKFKSWF